MDVLQPTHVTRLWFPPGYAGITVGTIKKMCELARWGEWQPRIRARAKWLTQHLESMDYDGELDAIWRWCCEQIRYLRDPENTEHITDPVQLDLEIDDGYGAEDCESIELYAAALLSSIGYRVLYEFQGHDPERPQQLTHAAMVVEHPRSKQWLGFDPVAYHFYARRGVEFDLGDSLYHPGMAAERWTLDGERVSPVSKGIGALMAESMFGDVNNAAAQQAAGILSAAGGAISSFGPYGAIVGGLANLTSGIVQAATGVTVARPVAPQPVTPPPLPQGYGYDASGKVVPLSPQAPTYNPATGQTTAGALPAAPSSLPSWALPVGGLALLGLILLRR